MFFKNRYEQYLGEQLVKDLCERSKDFLQRRLYRSNK